MKSKILIALFFASASMLVLNSCSKDDDDDDNGGGGDQTAPVITINGNTTEMVILNSSYTDAGATATDDVDGSVTVTTDNPVNKDSAGTYIVTYTASDNSGNTSTAIRTVTVYNEVEDMEGSYTTVEGTSTWTQTITASKLINKRIHFSKFANYQDNDDIYADVVGTTIVFPTQTAVSIGTNGCSHRFTQDGTGASITVVSDKYLFSIKFTDEQLAGGGGCPATGAVPYEDFFSQQ